MRQMLTKARTCSTVIRSLAQQSELDCGADSLITVTREMRSAGALNKRARQTRTRNKKSPASYEGGRVQGSSITFRKAVAVCERAVLVAACRSRPAISRSHLGWYRQNSLDHLLSTRSYPASAAMPKDAAYYELAS